MVEIGIFFDFIRWGGALIRQNKISISTINWEFDSLIFSEFFRWSIEEEKNEAL